MQQVLINQNLLKVVDFASLKSDVDKNQISINLKNVSTNLNNLKSKVDKFDVDKLLPVPVDVVKNDVVKKDLYNANIKNIVE